MRARVRLSLGLCVEYARVRVRLGLVLWLKLGLALGSV